MKRCPKCRKDSFDDGLFYCLEDGSALVKGYEASHEPDTVILKADSEPVSDHTSDSPANGTKAANSIAVLPFVNMSADADNEYFCDGLAEELLNALAKIDDLKVAARTASFSFRGKNAPMAEIGSTLNVSSILEGSVRKAGNRVRITVQLINATDGYHLWSERFDRDMNDIFEIQDEITLAVVDALKLKLLGSEKQAVLRRHTNDPAAYQLYLRGRHFFYKRTPEGFVKAIECFEKAIEIDGDYAVAVSGLSDCWVFQGFYEMVAPSVAAAHVGPLAKRALELDDTLTETNTSYALLKTLYEWDHSASLEYFEKGIAKDPKYAFAYHLESAVSAVMGDYERAISAELRAIELDPFTPVFNASLAWWYYIAGLNDKAVEQCKRTIDFAPNHFFAYWVLGLTYAAESAFSDSIVALQQAVSRNQFEAHQRADLARVFATMGEREAALEILAELEQLSTRRYVSPANIAKIYLGLGDDEAVIKELEKACEERSVRLPWVLADPMLDRMKDDPRLKEFRRRAGLPESRPM